MDREKKSQKEKLKGDVELELEDDETDEELEDEEDEVEDEDEWGEKEFVSDLSGEEDGLSDLEDAVVRASALGTDIYILMRLYRIPGRASRTSPATRTWTRMPRMKKPRHRSEKEKQPQHLHPNLRARDQKRSPRVCITTLFDRISVY